MKLFYTASAIDSRDFITDILKTHYGVSEPRFIVNEHGKPYLSDTPLFFNISHSGGITAAAVGTKEMGLDLQRRDTRRREAVFRRLTPAEREEDFFRLWTAKEAFVKYTGGTLAGMLPSLEFKAGTMYLRGAPADAWLYHAELNGCALCLCAAEREEVTFLELP